MEVTLAYIEERFHHFNQLCFGGKLPVPPFRLNGARRALGQVRYMRKRTLSGGCHYVVKEFVVSGLAARDMSENEVEDVILHEMIHLFIFSNQLQDTSAHGAIFRREMARINATYGRHITISKRAGSDGPSSQKSTDSRPNVVAVLCLSGGNWGMMVVARSRVVQIARALQRTGQVLEVKWYFSRNPFFNRFPRRSTLKYHPMSAAELCECLCDAIPFQPDGDTKGC